MQEITDPRWVRVADIDVLPPGEMLRVSVEGTDIALLNVEGELHAIGDTCTHAEASLTDGDFYEDIRGWVVECPLHGSQFSPLTGEALALPATGNCGKYKLKIEDQVIYLDPTPVIERQE